MEPDVVPVDPVILVFREFGIESFRIQVFNSHCLKSAGYCEDLFLGIGGLVYVICREREKIILRFSGSQSLIVEHGCAHGFEAVNPVAGVICIDMGHRESRVIESSAFADIILDDRAEGSRLFTASFSGEKAVDHFISSVTSLIESKCRIIGNAVFSHGHAVEHGRNVSVVSDVIGRAAVDGRSGCRRECNRGRAVVYDSYAGKLDPVGSLYGYESRDLGLNIRTGDLTVHLLP